MNIPNILTIFRIFLVPTYLYVFFKVDTSGYLYSNGIVLLAGLTDVLDGYIARKYDKTTKLGALLDPLADKLMCFAVLISLAYIEIIPMWILVVMIVKEVCMILGGSILYLFKGNKVLPSNIYGKLGTALFYLSIITVILGLSDRIIRYAFILTVAANVLAFINYLIIFIRMDTESNGMI